MTDEPEAPDTVTRSEFNSLAAEVAKNNWDGIKAMIAVIVVGFALIIALVIHSMNLETKIDDIAAQRDEVSSSYEPLLYLLDTGPHCYDSGAEAIAAQTRIFTAIDLEYLRNQTAERLDKRLNPGVGGSIDSPYMPVLPEVSKNSRDDRGKTCFTVSWPRDTKPRWAGGY
ncbi:hypothetical protein [Mycobacteroides chelonae]|uniref:hypothetical protein n=1 Tax=Mycobacteroides chelonae TaxID=1774 RepID=UPI0018B0E6B7|nr:hypothetical protein [Mycobacteroides chelonae]MBF9328499.1 hypothetical protein [Mycobacteroides chelonae]MBF9422677.1 hypothetical protein [Mycobacteroides chelonae]